MRPRGIVSLLLTILLCLPSLTGGATVLVNGLLHRQMDQWGAVSSASVASAVFLGAPLVLLAAVVSAVIGLSRGVSHKVKYAHYITVSLAAISTFFLTFHFGV
jgi:hypothetical protein